MSLASTLLKNYESAEEDIVDKIGNSLEEAVLLPIYHSNIRSNGKNVYELVMNTEGKIISGDFIHENEYSIFPVTEDSISRSSGSVARPLVDEFQYLVTEEDTKKEGLYDLALSRWIELESDSKIKEFLEIIYNRVVKQGIKEAIISEIARGREYNYSPKKHDLEVIEIIKGKPKKSKIPLAKVMITFTILEFEEGRDCSVTDYKRLHNAYINYVNTTQEKTNIICNVSGKKGRSTTKHRGMMGNARIITAGTDDKNLETYYGRFNSRAEVINISGESSNKIHNMIKYLLENPKTSKQMSFGKGSANSAVLCMWFSDDVENNRETNIMKPADLYSLGEEKATEKQPSYTVGGELTGKILNAAKGMNYKISETEKAYIMILDKVSKGRVSIKYFKEFNQGDFYENIRYWYESFSWYFYDFEKRNFTLQSPSLSAIMDGVYGVEYRNEDGKTKLKVPDSKNKYKEKIMTNLLPCVVEKKKIPIGIVKQAFQNCRTRERFTNSWEKVLSTSCAVLAKHRFDEMGEREDDHLKELEKQTRSYLYGRVLSLLEYLEITALEDSFSKRETNAERFWNSFTKAPAKTMKILIDKSQPYWKKLKQTEKNRGLFIIRTNELQECINRIEELEGGNAPSNNALNEDFIFGYYAQRKKIYTKKENL